MSPYRTPHARDLSSADDRAPDRGNGDLVLVALLFWSASVVRVASALLHHETFGAEATIAAIAVVLVPWSAAQSRWARRPSGE